MIYLNNMVSSSSVVQFKKRSLSMPPLYNTETSTDDSQTWLPVLAVQPKRATVNTLHTSHLWTMCHIGRFHSKMELKSRMDLKPVLDQGWFLTVGSIGEAKGQCSPITAAAGGRAANPSVECEDTHNYSIQLKSCRVMLVARISVTLWPIDWGVHDSSVVCWDFHRRTSSTCSGSRRPVKYSSQISRITRELAVRRVCQVLAPVKFTWNHKAAGFCKF